LPGRDSPARRDTRKKGPEVTYLLALQSTIVIILILLNGLFSMSETALVSARKAGLRQRADAGDGRARNALELADSPNRFLSTVQIGISLIGVLSGAVGGAALAEPLADLLSEAVPVLAPYAGSVTFAVVVGTSPTSS
jgi:putative hemolysin